MKRSLLLTSDFPPVIGGISTVYYQIWKHFNPDRMLILTPHADGDREFDRSSGVKPVRFYPARKGKAGKVAGMILMVKLSFYFVIFRSVREIHSGQVLSCGPAGYIIQRVFGIPCYLWLYGGESYSNYVDSPVKRFAARFFIKRCKYLVTNSPTTTLEFVDFGISRKRIIEIIPAVDSERFSPGPKSEKIIEKYGLEGKKLIVTVGRLVERKGHDLVLRALSLIAEDAHVHYVIVGDGEYRSDLERMTDELGISDRVTFTGRVEEDELPDYYRLSDIFIMPNRKIAGRPDSIEGFGMTFIEAGACERPVIGGRSGGAVDAIVDGVTGYLIDPEKPRDLADKIEYLFENPDICREMGRKARERAVNSFTWKNRAVQLAEKLSIPFVEIKDLQK